MLPRKINFEICGSEEYVMDPISMANQQFPLKYFASDQTISGKPYLTTNILYLRQYFKPRNAHASCPAQLFELLDTSLSPLTSSPNIQI